jgi:hypothetical protein
MILVSRRTYRRGTIEDILVKWFQVDIFHSVEDHAAGVVTCMLVFFPVTPRAAEYDPVEETCHGP